LSFGPLVSTAFLAEHAGDPEIRVVDVRWYLDAPARGREAYLAGHLPGALFLDVDADLAAPGGARGGPLGRHPWPSAAQVGEVMSRAGIGPGVRVVAYDDASGAIAARLWFLLIAHGHDDVAVLDGGITRWRAEGRPLTTELPRVAPCSFTPAPRPGLVLSKQDMLQLAPGTPVLDARAGERYRGETEPIDPRAGHIPGARSAPFTENLEGGVFRSPVQLRERFANLGAVDQAPIVYCGSGVTACHDLLALRVAGLSGRLYAGSWSEWSSDPSLPVATGPEPG
jgi:thiosulfate/3-mercaptopyruvate sulfurtransferase